MWEFFVRRFSRDLKIVFELAKLELHGLVLDRAEYIHLIIVFILMMISW